MASKRMFAKSIIDSDAFLDMPLSTQALYFHLNMRADDDGFINNPKKIQRMVGCSDDDLKVLIAKRFIIQFESGVIVIKHWRLHNTIQKDRYQPTTYIEEKALLREKENKAYTLDTNCIQDVSKVDTDCIQTVSKVEPQIRLDKNRLDKVRLDKNRTSNSSYPELEDFEPKCQAIASLYNEVCISRDNIRFVNETHKEYIRESLQSFEFEDFRKVFELAEKSSFLNGDNDTGWKAPFIWLIKAENMEKVLSGMYGDRKDEKEAQPKGAKEMNAFYDMLDEWVSEDDQKGE